MKVKIKNFAADQVTKITVSDFIKQNREIIDYIKDMKSSETWTIDLSDKKQVSLTIDPKTREIRVDNRVFRVGKWDDVNICFNLSFASANIQDDKSLSYEQKVSYLFDYLTGWVRGNVE